MNFQFKKMHGCGNDFLIIDCIKRNRLEFRKAEIQFLCNRHFGIGADGLVILNRSQIADASWRFFNSDGSEAEMCGNAARCVVRYLGDHYGLTQEMVSIDTLIGIIKGRRVGEGLYEVTLSAQKDARYDYVERILDIDGNVFQVFSVDTGVPHAVLEVKDLRTYPIARVGKLIQAHATFKPAGTNVTFFQRQGVRKILSTTFERGVEAETMACGTGAAAAAIVFSQLYMESPPVDVRVPGGELVVDLSPISKILLVRGGAEYVMEVELEDIPHHFETPQLFGEKRMKKEPTL